MSLRDARLPSSVEVDMPAPMPPEIVLKQLRTAVAMMQQDKSAAARKKHLNNIDYLLDRYLVSKDSVWEKVSPE